MAVTWADFQESEPGLAALVQERFERGFLVDHGHQIVEWERHILIEASQQKAVDPCNMFLGDRDFKRGMSQEPTWPI